MIGKIQQTKQWLWGLFFLLFSIPTFANTLSIPTMTSHVVDEAHLLTTEQRDSLARRLALFQQQTGSQIAILIVKSTSPLDIESYAEKVFNQWRIGRINIDDGVLLLVSVNDRTMRIEVGYGLEGAISDSLAKRILEYDFIPEFKRGNYAGGLNRTIDSLIALIKNEPLPDAKTPSFFISKQPAPFGLLDASLAIVLAASAYIWLFIIYHLIKLHKLKAAIPIAIILLLTAYTGGFNNPAGNGMKFGEDFLYTELPRWSQFLFLKILPTWMVFILSLSLCLLRYFYFYFWLLLLFIKYLASLLSQKKSVFRLLLPSYLLVLFFYLHSSYQKVILLFHPLFQVVLVASLALVIILVLSMCTLVGAIIMAEAAVVEAEAVADLAEVVAGAPVEAALQGRGKFP
ncbi:TPM domain-containing protein [Providencia stuartii]|uniref:TPM domain-containing protein n=1 Tax=Providencia stuartii TaxID=588 RepID=UPI0028842DCB|nr:TPM domain-containing protein [Providencia stuartii]MDT1066074.1 TPM domain-containing protein [Providencia stuartii]